MRYDNVVRRFNSKEHLNRNCDIAIAVVTRERGVSKRFDLCRTRVHQIANSVLMGAYKKHDIKVSMLTGIATNEVVDAINAYRNWCLANSYFANVNKESGFVRCRNAEF